MHTGFTFCESFESRSHRVVHVLCTLYLGTLPCRTHTINSRPSVGFMFLPLASLGDVGLCGIMLSVSLAASLSFSPPSQATARHRATLLTAAANPPSDRLSPLAPALDNALSRRAALLNAATVAASAPLAALAGDDTATAKARV